MCIPLHDVLDGLDLSQVHGGAVRLEVNEVAQHRQRRRLDRLLEQLVGVGVLGADRLVQHLHPYTHVFVGVCL